ncbi:hypothetical protein [Helicobacter sp. T3_23-1056]
MALSKELKKNLELILKNPHLQAFEFEKQKHNDYLKAQENLAKNASQALSQSKTGYYYEPTNTGTTSISPLNSDSSQSQKTPFMRE